VYNTDRAASWMDGDFNDDGIVDVLDAADLMGGGLYEAGNYLPSTAQQRRSTV
jgi:hypothetical protein